jgi:hypothetical protein
MERNGRIEGSRRREMTRPQRQINTEPLNRRFFDRLCYVEWGAAGGKRVIRYSGQFCFAGTGVCVSDRINSAACDTDSADR